MAIENGNKLADINVDSSSVIRKDKLGRLLLGLRLGALVATTSAALTMGLNKQTKNTIVAVVGTTPVYQELTAKFQYTPAFVYFVVANAIASGYNLLVLLLKYCFVRNKNKSFAMWIHITDLVMLALVAAGAAAATAMAVLGKKGNDHARWSPVCNKFASFCTHGGSALISSFTGAALLLILTAVSTVRVYKLVPANRNFN